MYYLNKELSHSGIKGQRWGIRRFQNEDGSLTELGRLRYDDKRQRHNERREDKKQRHEERREDDWEKRNERKVKAETRSQIISDAKIMARGNAISRRVLYSSLAATNGRHYANKVWEQSCARRLGKNALIAAAATGAFLVVGKLGLNGVHKNTKEIRQAVQKGIQTVAPKIAMTKYNLTH